MVDRIEALRLVRRSVAGLGYRKIAALMRADGHEVTNSPSPEPLRRRGLLLPQGFPGRSQILGGAAPQSVS